MLKIFSGTANRNLSQEVSDILHTPLSKAEIVRFSNSEVRVRIEDDVKNSNCVVIQPTANPTDTNLIELFFMCDALRRKEAKRVIGIIPYFGYARQDVQHREGECVSVNVVIKFLESIGFHKIYTVDLHDEATEGVFSIPFKNLTSLELLVSTVKKYLKVVTPETIAIGSPDQGGIERARKFGTFLFGTSDFPLVVIEKKRDLSHIHKSEAVDMYGSTKGKTVILVDDIVTSGGTLRHAAEISLSKGAKNVLAAIVHHDFAVDSAAKLQDSPIEKFFTTNTIELKKEHEFKKLQEISIASLIAEEIKSF